MFQLKLETENMVEWKKHRTASQKFGVLILTVVRVWLAILGTSLGLGLFVDQVKRSAVKEF